MSKLYVRRTLLSYNAEADLFGKIVSALRMTALLKQNKNRNKNKKNQHLASSLQFQTSHAISHCKINSWPNDCFFYYKSYTCRKFERRKQNHSPFKESQH